MMKGVSAPRRRSRIVSIRSGYPSPTPAPRRRYAVKLWQGGEAWINVVAVEGPVEGVAEVELERVARLGGDVHSHDFEACSVVPDCRAARSAEQVQQPGLHGTTSTVVGSSPVVVR